LTRRTTAIYSLAMNCRFLLGVLALLWCSGPLRADERTEAREHYRRGTAAFNLGHYEDAIREYEAAYQLREDPALLYNIAQAYRLAGDETHALRTYKSFLHQLPKAENREEVEQRIIELQRAIGERGRAKESTAPATPQVTAIGPSESAKAAREVAATGDHAAARRWYRDPGTLSLLGIGVALSGAGIGVAVAGAADISRSTSAADLQDHDRFRSSGIALQASGYAAMGAGVVCVAAAIVRWRLLARRSPRATAVSSVSVLGGAL
jgi:tetratricopeptide (TPR) repeat protein